MATALVQYPTLPRADEMQGVENHGPLADPSPHSADPSSSTPRHTSNDATSGPGVDDIDPDVASLLTSAGRNARLNQLMKSFADTFKDAEAKNLKKAFEKFTEKWNEKNRKRVQPSCLQIETIQGEAKRACDAMVGMNLPQEKSERKEKEAERKKNEKKLKEINDMLEIMVKRGFPPNWKEVLMEAVNRRATSGVLIGQEPFRLDAGRNNLRQQGARRDLQLRDVEEETKMVKARLKELENEKKRLKKRGAGPDYQSSEDRSHVQASNGRLNVSRITNGRRQAAIAMDQESGDDRVTKRARGARKPEVVPRPNNGPRPIKTVYGMTVYAFWSRSLKVVVNIGTESIPDLAIFGAKDFNKQTRKVIERTYEVSYESPTERNNEIEATRGNDDPQPLCMVTHGNATYFQVEWKDATTDWITRTLLSTIIGKAWVDGKTDKGLTLVTGCRLEFAREQEKNKKRLKNFKKTHAGDPTMRKKYPWLWNANDNKETSDRRNSSDRGASDDESVGHVSDADLESVGHVSEAGSEVGSDSEAGSYLGSDSEAESYLGSDSEAGSDPGSDSEAGLEPDDDGDVAEPASSSSGHDDSGSRVTEIIDTDT